MIRATALALLIALAFAAGFATGAAWAATPRSAIQSVVPDSAWQQVAPVTTGWPSEAPQPTPVGASLDAGLFVPSKGGEESGYPEPGAPDAANGSPDATAQASPRPSVRAMPWPTASPSRVSLQQAPSSASVVGSWSTAIASWYGAEDFGNRTACGQLYTSETWGVAHKTLACGTRIDVRFGGRVAYGVPVVDRGPFVAGRTFDLSSAVAKHLGFEGVHAVDWRLVR